MPKYQVMVEEVHVLVHTIEADTPTEAREMVLRGKGRCLTYLNGQEVPCAYLNLHQPAKWDVWDIDQEPRVRVY